MKLTLPFDLSNLGTSDDFNRYGSQSIKQIIDVINGKLNFQDNIESQIVSVSFGTANQDVSASHSLRRVPTGFIPVGLSAAMIVYNGSTSNTDGIIYLRSSAVGTAQVLVF